jgi:hypothetical protein
VGFLLWICVLAPVLFVLSYAPSRDIFKELTTAYPFIMGAIKFSLLGSMGDVLSGRFATGKWNLIGREIVQKAMVWAFLGMTITAVFPLFVAGTGFLFEHGYFVQPFSGTMAAVFTAFTTSVFMNLIFAPMMMLFHKVTDTVINQGGLFRRWHTADVMAGIHWQLMLRIPLFSILWFWIPAHTITFLLPPEYRVVFAALLAIVLGFILGFAAQLSRKTA